MFVNLEIIWLFEIRLKSLMCVFRGIHCIMHCLKHLLWIVVGFYLQVSWKHEYDLEYEYVSTLKMNVFGYIPYCVLEIFDVCFFVQSTTIADRICLYFWEIPLLTVCVCVCFLCRTHIWGIWRAGSPCSRRLWKQPSSYPTRMTSARRWRKRGETTVWMRWGSWRRSRGRSTPTGSRKEGNPPREPHWS